MKKIFVLCAMLMPAGAFALETSDCETIGYFQSTTSTCDIYYDECMDKFSSHMDCTKLPRTAQECAEKIARENAESAVHDVLLKCPATDARLGDKARDKTTILDDAKYISADGREINIDDLIADNEHVYYLHFAYLIDAGEESPWLVLGAYNEYGANFSVVK